MDVDTLLVLIAAGKALKLAKIDPHAYVANDLQDDAAKVDCVTADSIAATALGAIQDTGEDGLFEPFMAWLRAREARMPEIQPPLSEFLTPEMLARVMNHITRHSSLHWIALAQEARDNN